MNSFSTQTDEAMSANVNEVLLSELGVASFSETCGQIDWACTITNAKAETDTVARIESNVTESRWAPASCGANIILDLLRRNDATSSISVVKYVNDSGTVLQTSDKITSRFGDCQLPQREGGR
ncbi:hypothetical protein ERC79_20245 [Rhodococcus sp. ABRD24]|uniref:hypothetical protein n=1 Tax=Rhodococcus sp. ABRD24 TaxID=2507582 RepID=UPI00103C1535|nr:hypothetical protein [Rhodococcus sp. ABRD24]QBJ98009.1 hypothetical protein ERC79_20245 [Rhodococcus sp. ABRD24]